MIAGLPQAPSEFNPFRNPTAALERRNEVLGEMVKSKYITRQAADKAAAQGLGLNRGDRYTQRREPYFFDYVEEQLIERYGVGVYRRGGLKIHTTIDPKLQKAGRQAIRSNLYYKNDPSSAIVSIDPANGYIRAMASSGTYNDRTFNLAAQGHRQPGSAFKTFVLVTAHSPGHKPRHDLLHVEAADRSTSPATGRGTSRPTATATSGASTSSRRRSSPTTPSTRSSTSTSAPRRSRRRPR